MQPQVVTFDEALGMALDHHRAGRLAAAEAIYRQILAAQPNHVGALNFLGMLAHQVDRLDVAREMLSKAISLSPDFPDAYNNLAAVLTAEGDAGGAERCYRQAISLLPGYVDAHINLGNLLWQLGRSAEAADHCREAVRLAPDNAAAHNNLANALAQSNDVEAAAEHYERAVALQPDFAGAHNNLANALCEMGRAAEALEHYTRAAALQPSVPDYVMNLGNALRDLGRIPEAVAAYHRTLALAPGSGETRWNLAMTLLLGGDYARGWDAYQARWETRKLAPLRRRFAVPQWDGADPAGRTILIHAEQGMGDVIQFCRYLPLVRARGARTVLLIDSGWRQLAALLRGLDGVDQVALDLTDVTSFDLHCPLLDLPRLFGTTLATIPAHVPYLTPDAARRSAWRARLAGRDPSGATLRVGLVWAGNPNFARDRLRSPRLEPLLPLLDQPNVRWFGLQAGDGSRDLEGRALPATFCDLGPELGDFADTAAAMAELDLVISSCTAAAHLSGALGRPTWVLLPVAPDWRWLLERDDSPWYPTARLFRQPAVGRWDLVVERVRSDLAALVDGDRTRLTGGAAR
ncbi:MAG TPA: tetratricopeptide repeat-containing glycosyltransferase family protein [Candidatus Sulfotelmatobacter sp.]|nr:tetratricopeptide repeat-containing glycosyltransferase family protein [Candidatus Sulfotelmatobacter sp.]